jgi:hypothetical protein
MGMPDFGFFRQMATKKNGNNGDSVKIDHIVAWAMWRSKAGVDNIANKFDICRATVHNWVNRVEALVSERIDLDKLKTATLLCFPSALESLSYNLEVKKDPSVTNNFLNKTVFSDIKESEINVNTNAVAVGGELSKELRQFDIAELRNFREELRSRIAEKRKSSLVLCDQVSQDH